MAPSLSSGTSDANQFVFLTIHLCNFKNQTLSSPKSDGRQLYRCMHLGLGPMNSKDTLPYNEAFLSHVQGTNLSMRLNRGGISPTFENPGPPLVIEDVLHPMDTVVIGGCDPVIGGEEKVFQVGGDEWTSIKARSPIWSMHNTFIDILFVPIVKFHYQSSFFD